MKNTSILFLALFAILNFDLTEAQFLLRYERELSQMANIDEINEFDQILSLADDDDSELKFLAGQL